MSPKAFKPERAFLALCIAGVSLLLLGANCGPVLAQYANPGPYGKPNTGSSHSFPYFYKNGKFGDFKIDRCKKNEARSHSEPSRVAH